MVTRSSTPKRRTYRMVARAEAAAATRERMLAAAWRNFSERPYEDVPLADIAAEAGVSVQTLHSGFGPKDSLFVAAWAWMGANEMARRDAVVVGDVEAAIRLLYDSYEHRGDAVLRLLAQEDRIPAVHRMAEAGRAYHRGWVARTFAPLLAGLPRATRQRRRTALVVATDLLVWKLLRRDLGIARPTAERIATDMVAATRGVS